MENVVTISDLNRDDVGCVLSCRAINNNISSPVETTVHLDVICESQYTHTRVVRPVTCQRKSKVSVFVIRYFICLEYIGLEPFKQQGRPSHYHD